MDGCGRAVRQADIHPGFKARKGRTARSLATGPATLFYTTTYYKQLGSQKSETEKRERKERKKLRSHAPQQNREHIRYAVPLPMLARYT